MNPNKALWEKGDFTRIAESMRESGDELVARIDVAHGEGPGSRLRRWNDGSAGGAPGSGSAGGSTEGRPMSL